MLSSTQILRITLILGDLLIKGRASGGNRVTKEIVSKIIQKEVGGSTLAARKIWFDSVVSRLNDDNRGKFLGNFKGTDKILTLYSSGEYRLTNFDLSIHFDDDMIHIEKWVPENPISAVYFDADKELHYCKRFVCEVTSDKKVSFISDAEGSTLDFVSTAYKPQARIIYNKQLKATKNLPDTVINIDDFIEVKGMKSQGNQITKLKVKEIVVNIPEGGEEEWPKLESEEEQDIISEEDKPATTVEWDVQKGEDEDPDQAKLF